VSGNAIEDATASVIAWETGTRRNAMRPPRSARTETALRMTESATATVCPRRIAGPHPRLRRPHPHPPTTRLHRPAPHLHHPRLLPLPRRLVTFRPAHHRLSTAHPLSAFPPLGRPRCAHP
jgi:hypothetical protein